MKVIKVLIFLFFLIILLNSIYGLQCHDQITSGNATNDTQLYYIYDDFDDDIINLSYWWVRGNEIEEANGSLKVSSVFSGAWGDSYATNIASQINGSLPRYVGDNDRLVNITIEFQFFIEAGSVNQNYHIIFL